MQGLIQVCTGAKGGYQLKVPAEEISAGGYYKTVRRSNYIC